ncbi:glycosyltransferase family 4 protein [Desulfovibrio sp. OttesenSCG-928-G15]|nr:glycosyltransferase family 4 protein [Desulfovibrio sp. OttesenSCG-928-G15]
MKRPPFPVSFYATSMNILYTNFHTSSGGGHTTYILQLLENREHTSFVACPENSKLYNILRERGFPGLVGIEFPGGLRSPRAIASNTLKLANAIREWNIDIVHTNGSADNRLLLYASWICRKKFKVVFTKHNTYPIKGFFSRLRLKYFNDAVIMVGPHVAACAAMGESPRFTVVEHGINLDYWKKTTPLREEGGVIHLVSTSGTSHHKGWTHMVDALAGLLPEERERFRLTVIGRHVPWQEDEAKRCNITFPGYQDDTRPWLEDADIGFVLSYHEASSYAAREMMAMSLPVILSDFKGFEPAYDPACAWVTKIQDTSSIQQALRVILSLPRGELSRMKLAARQKAEKDFALERCIAETNAVYERIMRA